MASTALLSHPRYAAGEVLGRGAQGVVVRVTDREHPTRALVAKVWRAGAFDEGSLRGEFALLARLRADGVVRAHDLGRDEITNAPFFVEDFAAGEDATSWVALAPTRARSGRVTTLIAGVARALAGLHDGAFTHGDLKPAHVRVDPTRGPMLLDLGAALAKGRAHTKAFAAPEILAGGEGTPASDLFGVGALAWASVTGSAPPRTRGALRDFAPWLAPRIAELIEALLAEHPRDRPESARDVLAQVGFVARSDAMLRAPPPAPIGREREVTALLAARGVTYLVGASGAGKSHLARELVTRALLEGRAARRLVFPGDAGDGLARLVAYLRGARDALPFFVAPNERLLLVLDDLDRAPGELAAALEAHRCRDATADLDVIATAKAAPEGAPRVALGPLSEGAIEALCTALGVDRAHAADLARASNGLPGWIVASCADAPLSGDAVLARLAMMSGEAAQLLSAIAIAGGELPIAVARTLAPMLAFEDLASAALVTRRASIDGVTIALAAPSLADDLAAALTTQRGVDALSDALLDHPCGASALLATARAKLAPTRRFELLDRAAVRARASGARAIEIDALLAICADPARRKRDVLVRLERLTRDAGSASTHPEVLGWLDEAAAIDASVAPLALRRRAEQVARAGDRDRAEALATEALEAARRAGDGEAEAYAHATLGLVHLYRAAWPAADRAFADARSRLASQETNDAEEVARLEHNAGVVALYRGRARDAADAFERSLASKRRFGDRGGMRACLLNLGLALARAGDLDQAERALEEGERLARSLGQRAGLGWCLAAHADVLVRRRDARGAERKIAEAEELMDALPAAIRADLALLRAEVALLEGQGDRAVAALETIDAATREGDPLIDLRAQTIAASARLARLPADARGAARGAIKAARAARRAALPEVEASALNVVRAARAARRTQAAEYHAPMPASPGADSALWAWIAALGAGADVDEAALDLAQLVLRSVGAERAFVVELDAAGSIARAWGADLDGLSIADAARRVDVETARAAARSSEPVYQRELETPAGRGSRLVVAAGRAVVVVEHRFAPGRFDAVDAEHAKRWAALASLLTRAGQAAAHHDEDAPTAPRVTAAQTAPPPPSEGETTVVPTLTRKRDFPTILGESSALQRALARVDLAIDASLPVLFIGETGTGKELFARAVHDHGARSKSPFVAINCGAITDSLFEAELFGHARGSFTGAERPRPGLFARAEGGTLFLDEIGELPIARQATLLRALETRRYRPVGADEERPFDVRVVAATNRDLAEAIADGSFRRDLYYRLNAIEIVIPPLRERLGDVPTLARSFLSRAGSRAQITPEALEALDRYAWPGNVRELQNQMERLVGLGVTRISLEHLPRQMRATREREPRAAEPQEPDERVVVQQALERAKGNISHAATHLGLTRHGLKKRMIRLGLREAPKKGT
jgi:transcriptional regulator with AAA-type ATPase domain